MLANALTGMAAAKRPVMPMPANALTGLPAGANALTGASAPQNMLARNRATCWLAFAPRPHRLGRRPRRLVSPALTATVFQRHR